LQPRNGWLPCRQRQRSKRKPHHTSNHVIILTRQVRHKSVERSCSFGTIQGSKALIARRRAGQPGRETVVCCDGAWFYFLPAAAQLRAEFCEKATRRGQARCCCLGSVGEGGRTRCGTVPVSHRYLAARDAWALQYNTRAIDIHTQGRPTHPQRAPRTANPPNRPQVKMGSAPNPRNPQSTPRPSRPDPSRRLDRRIVPGRPPIPLLACGLPAASRSPLVA
jgi:hypothetical protein